MFSIKSALKSGVARKLVNAITAVALVGFIIVHLLGNLALYMPDGSAAFNEYSAKLHGLGPGLWVIEAILFSIFAVHAFIGLSLWLSNRRARKDNYEAAQQTKGGPSKFNMSSLTMAVTGSVLLVFVVVHVSQFRFGLFDDTSKYEEAGEAGTYDLYSLVVDTFQEPGWVVFYAVATFLLGWHLRHGFWSMLQTIGAMNDRWTKPVYVIGTILAILLAAGFFFIPFYLYFQ